MLRLVDFSTSPWPPQRGRSEVGPASVNGGPAEVALQKTTSAGWYSSHRS